MDLKDESFKKDKIHLKDDLIRTSGKAAISKVIEEDLGGMED